MPRLRRVACSEPGIRRIASGRGFRYVDPDGAAVADADTLSRIDELVIPPAWTEVWICAHPRGHLQATGLDAAGRKQYRYHDLWRTRRDRRKFDEMLDFARSLPRLRRRVQRDLRRDAMSSSGRVLACAVRLLDIGFFRVGGEQYADENGGYGLATLLRRHATLRPDGVLFEYPAKSGTPRSQLVADADVKAIVAFLKRRRGGGPELLAWKDRGRWRDVRSDEINTYLKDASGADISAKDFRTWNGTVLAAVALALRSGDESRSARKRAVAAAMGDVAFYLGNTPTVARTSYVDPRVIDRFHAGETIAAVKSRSADAGGPDLADFKVRAEIERAVVDLLADADASSSGA